MRAKIKNQKIKKSLDNKKIDSIINIAAAKIKKGEVMTLEEKEKKFMENVDESRKLFLDIYFDDDACFSVELKEKIIRLLRKLDSLLKGIE